MSDPNDPNAVVLVCDYREGAMRIMRDDQGDVYFTIGPVDAPIKLSGESVRIAASGTRHSRSVRAAAMILFHAAKENWPEVERLAKMMIPMPTSKPAQPVEAPAFKVGDVVTLSGYKYVGAIVRFSDEGAIAHTASESDVDWAFATKDITLAPTEYRGGKWVTRDEASAEDDACIVFDLERSEWLWSLAESMSYTHPASSYLDAIEKAERAMGGR